MGDEQFEIDDVFVNDNPKGEDDFSELFLVDGIDDIPKDNTPPEEPEEVRLLREQNEALNRQLQDWMTKADTATSLQEGIRQLGDTLRAPQQMMPPKPMTPEEMARKREEFNTNFMDDPQGYLERFQQEKVAPVLTDILQTNTQYSKEFMMMDPNAKRVYDAYPQEVEQEFKNLPPQTQYRDPQAYRKAAQIVRARHIDDEQAAMREQIKQELMQELGLNKKSPPPAQPQHSEKGNGPSSSGVRSTKTNVLPKAVWEHAGIRGLQGRGEPEDKARVYNMWKEGTLKVQGYEYGK